MEHHSKQTVVDRELAEVRVIQRTADGLVTRPSGGVLVQYATEGEDRRCHSGSNVTA